MGKMIFCIIGTVLFLSLASFSFAIDEDAYVQFAADSTITLNKLKGNPKALEIWMDEMQARHPDYMNPDWQEFGERLTKDKALKDRIYNRILEDIRAKGHQANLIDLGGGVTAIEIED